MSTAHLPSGVEADSDDFWVLPFAPRVMMIHQPATEPPAGGHEPMRLTQFYEEHLLPTRERRISVSTRKADFEALNAWRKYTEDIDFAHLDWSTPAVTRQTLKYLRAQLQGYVKGMEAEGITATTINKRLRHIRTMLRKAADPIDHGFLEHVPDLGNDFTGTNSGWKIREHRLPPRETITSAEMERLFRATDQAHNPHLWKVIVLMLWSFGARTEDSFYRIAWNLIDFDRNIMQFTANKTSKLQGVPLTPLLVRALRSLQTSPIGAQAPAESAAGTLVFGRIGRGTWAKSRGWVEGYYTTWSRDILPAGGFAVNKGPEEFQKACAIVPNVRPNLMFHHFRKTMVTELNIYSGQAGNWVAAHYMPGVSEQFYDTPTERIATAVANREAERLPKCFHEYFA